MKDDLLIWQILESTGLLPLDRDPEVEKRIHRIIENSGDDLLWIRNHQKEMPFSYWLLERGGFDELVEIIGKMESGSVPDANKFHFLQKFRADYSDYSRELESSLIWKSQSLEDAQADFMKALSELASLAIE